MASPSSDRLQQIIDGVYQDTMAQERAAEETARTPSPPTPNPRRPRPHRTRHSNVRKKVGRVTRGLGKAAIQNDSDSDFDETFVSPAPNDPMAPSPDPPPTKKRKREEPPSSSADLLVSVSLARGIDPVDFTMIKNCALEDVNTMPKLKKLLCSRFPHELKTLKTAPESLRLLAYRFKLAGESEWTAVSTQNELRDHMVTLKKNAAASILVQVCILEEDADVEGPLLLGRAGKDWHGEEIEIEKQEGEEEDDESAMVMLSKEQREEWLRGEGELIGTAGQLDAANEMLEEKDEELKTLKEEIKMLKEAIKALKGRLGEA